MSPTPSSNPWADRATAVRTGEGLDLRKLEAYLARELPEAAGPLSVEQFPSGFSNLTYLLRFGERSWVLRRPPFGTEVKTAHDMGREYRILSRIRDIFPKVPEPILFCEDTTVVGAPFYLMERVQGVILRPRMPSGMAPGEETMRGIARSLVRTQVELHAADFESAGLADLGRPRGYTRRQIEGWTGRYQAAQTDEVPEIDAAAAWLAGNQPPESAAALIHNDFKYDNLVLDEADWTRVLAVLDWEMATLGDPLMDLGTTLGYWLDPEDPPALRELRLSPTTLPGNPRRAELVQEYARVSGRAVDHVVFYYVYGLFKIAVIVQQIYGRYRAGLTHDVRFASLIDAVRGLGQMAGQAIARQRIDRLFD